MKRFYLIVFMAFLFAVQAIHAQDFTIFCGKKELRYDYGGKGNFLMVVLCPYKEYKNTSYIPKKIVSINECYLKNRVGKSFFSKLKLASAFVIDFNDTTIKTRESWVKKADKRVKYAFQYYFIAQKGVRYYMTTVYDSLGNLLSNHMLPSQKLNSQFGNIINICRAKYIAEHDTVYNGTVGKISLEYSDSISSFIWDVELVDLKTKIANVQIRRYLNLNASTGAIIKREEQEVYSSCDGNTPPFPKLK